MTMLNLIQEYKVGLTPPNQLMSCINIKRDNTSIDAEKGIWPNPISIHNKNPKNLRTKGTSSTS